MAFPNPTATNTSKVDAAGLSHVVNLPSGITAGQLLIVEFGWGATGQTNPLGWPSGWTQFFWNEQTAGGNEGGAAAWRKADGNEGATITVTTSASTKSSHNSHIINGAADPTVQPPEAATAIGTNANADPPSLAPTGGAKDYLWIAVGNNFGPTNYTGFPASYSGGITIATTGGSASVNTKTGSAYRQLNAASENPGAFSGGDEAGTSEWVGATIAIHPAGGGTQYQQPASGALNSSGEIAKQAKTEKIGDLSSAGTIAKEIVRALLGELTGSGISIKQTRIAWVGTLTSGGALSAIRTAFLSISGALSSAGELIKQTRTSKIGSVMSVGALSKQTRTSKIGSVMSVGALSKQTQTARAGTLTGNGALDAIRTILVSIGGALSSAGVLVRRTITNKVGSMSSTGALLKQTITAKLGSVSSAGLLTKQVQTAKAGTFTTNGVLSALRVAFISIGGMLSSGGTLIKQAMVLYAGDLTPSGALAKLVKVFLSGALNISATLITNLITIPYGAIMRRARSAKQVMDNAIARVRGQSKDQLHGQSKDQLHGQSKDQLR